MAENRFDVYLSHSTKDRAWAEALARELSRRGVKVFGPRNLESNSYPFEGLESSQSLVVLWSHHARDSDWVKGSIGRYFDLHQQPRLGRFPFLQVWLDGTPLPRPEFQAISDLRRVYVGGSNAIDIDDE